MNLLLVDNYDSFSFNLVQLLAELGARVEVVRNDARAVEECLSRRPAGYVISPGPGRPEQAGICLPLVRRAAAADVPVLGVCLGLQTVALAYGGRLRRARRPMHGKVSAVRHAGHGVFQGLPSPFEATRYHSLVACDDALPPELEVTARSEDGEIMGLRHRRARVEGVQFHPESVLTRAGRGLLANFLAACGSGGSA
jgi:anthranilate synthase/aminodeoxychorismate synthase-like glutamine amidotransferase